MKVSWEKEMVVGGGQVKKRKEKGERGEASHFSARCRFKAKIWESHFLPTNYLFSADITLFGFGVFSIGAFGILMPPPSAAVALPPVSLCHVSFSLSYVSRHSGGQHDA